MFIIILISILHAHCNNLYDIQLNTKRPRHLALEI